MTNERLLACPVESLGFSEEFCERCRLMGIATLGDVLALTPAELAGRQGFSYHWLAELSDYLAGKGLLHLLQPLPGSNAR